MYQSAMHWQEKFRDEQAARVKADRVGGIWRNNARQLERDNQALKRIVSDLEPLRVWAGYPHKVCEPPTAGAVFHEAAGKIIKNLSHSSRSKKDSGPSFGTLLAGGADLRALSQLSSRTP